MQATTTEATVLLVWEDSAGKAEYKKNIGVLKQTYNAFKDELNKVLPSEVRSAEVIAEAIQEPETFVKNHFKSLMPDKDPKTKLPVNKDAALATLTLPDLSKLKRFSNEILNLAEKCSSYPLIEIGNTDFEQDHCKNRFDTYTKTENETKYFQAMLDAVESLNRLNALHKQVTGGSQPFPVDRIIKPGSGFNGTDFIVNHGPFVSIARNLNQPHIKF